MNGKTVAIVLALCGAALTGIHAADVVWTGGAGDGNKWSTPGNWQGGAAPTGADRAIFNASEALTVDVDTEDATAQRIRINAASAPVTFGGAGKLTLTCEGMKIPGTYEQAQDYMPVLNLNCVNHFTTFDCRFHISAEGKISYGPGCIYNNDVTTASGYAQFGGIKNVMPAEECKKSIFKAGFDYAGTATASRQVYVGFSPTHDVVVDNGASGKIFKAYETFAFSINAAEGETHGKFIVKSGRAEVSGLVSHKATGTSGIIVEGGVFAAKNADATIGPFVQVLGNGVFEWGQNMYSGGNAQVPVRFGYGNEYFIKENFRLCPLQNCPVFATDTEPSEMFIEGELAMAAGWSLNLDIVSRNNTVLNGNGKGKIIADDIRTFGYPCIIRNMNITLGKQISANRTNGALTFDNCAINLSGDIVPYTEKSTIIGFAGTNVIDTFDANGSGTAHDAVFKTVQFSGLSSGLKVRGGGNVTFVHQANTTAETGLLEVEAGTTLDLAGCKEIKVKRLVLADGAVLVATNGTLRAEEFVAGEGSEIRTVFADGAEGSVSFGSVTQNGRFTLRVKEIPAGTSDAAYPLVFGAGLDETRTDVVIGDGFESGYAAKHWNSGVYLAPQNASAVPAGSWTGAVDGRWTEPRNWQGGAVPEARTDVLFAGSENIAVSNDSAEWKEYASISFGETAGPFAISGNAVVLTNGFTQVNNVDGIPPAILSSSRLPQTIGCDITFKHPTVIVKSTAGGSIILNGQVRTTDGEYTDHFYVLGDVRFGGNAEIHKLLFTGWNTKLTVLSGGSVKIVNQENMSAQTLDSGTLEIDAGGTFEWAQTSAKPFAWTKAGRHRVDGTLKVCGTYGMTNGKSQTFYGSGRMDVAGFNYIKGQTLAAEDGLKLNLGGDFATVNENGAEHCAGIVLSNATLGALCDWTYGPGAEVMDVQSVAATAQQRALRLMGGCAIDTQNPDTAEAHCVTLKEFVDGSNGTLTKKGRGDLVLKADTADCANNFAGGLVLEGGRIVLDGPLTGTAGDVKFAGGALSATKAFRSSLAGAGWTTLLKAQSVTGVPPATDGRLVFRIVEEEGCVELQACAKGMVLIIR